MSQADHRICFVGDSFVQGTGDALCLGWVGRVAAHARYGGVDLTYYNLGIRRHTSRDIAARWQQECAVRLPADCQRYVVFSCGVNDTTVENGALRVPEAESVQHFLAILSQAAAQYTTAVIGPPPVAESAHNARILHLSRRFADAASDLGVPYLSVYEALATDTVWMTEVAAGDGSHPGAGGYTRLAELVLAWRQWWFQWPMALQWSAPQAVSR